MNATPRLTVMTYNVHGCLGLDGRRSPERIAEVIRAAGPDVIALQEMDVLRARSGRIDQAERIAGLLGMKSHFYTTVEDGEGRYGGAVLSRFPVAKVKSSLLPGLAPREPRGALWVEVDFHGCAVQVLATHLGLRRGERASQVAALLGSGWCRHPRFQAPAILCGDFNMTRRAAPYREIAGLMRDARAQAPEKPPGGTWMGVARLDHIFVTPGIGVHSAGVVRTMKSRLASDHFPLYARLSV